LARQFLFAFGEGRERRHHDSGVKSQQRIFKPLKVRVLSLDFPGNPNGSVFVPPDGFNCVQILAAFPELVDQGTVFLHFLNAKIRQKVPGEVNFNIFVVVQDVFL
jgi:hypothetical protein